MEELFEKWGCWRRTRSTSSSTCRVLLVVVVILNVSEYYCAVRNGKSTSVLRRIGEGIVDLKARNESEPGKLLGKETILADERINNSSLPFALVFSSVPLPLKGRLPRVKRDYDEEADREKINEDHARSFRLFYFLGGIAIAIFTVIFLATLICFCCPSCYMHKRQRAGGESLSGSGNVYQSSGSAGGQDTTITAARSSSIVMATLPFQQQRRSLDHGGSQAGASASGVQQQHRKSQDYGQSPGPSTSQGFTYSSTYPETIDEIATIN